MGRMVQHLLLSKSIKSRTSHLGFKLKIVSQLLQASRTFSLTPDPNSTPFFIFCPLSCSTTTSSTNSPPDDLFSSSSSGAPPPGSQVSILIRTRSAELSDGSRQDWTLDGLLQQSGILWIDGVNRKFFCNDMIRNDFIPSSSSSSSSSSSPSTLSPCFGSAEGKESNFQEKTKEEKRERETELPEGVHPFADGIKTDSEKYGFRIVAWNGDSKHVYYDDGDDRHLLDEVRSGMDLCRPDHPLIHLPLCLSHIPSFF